MTWGWAKKVFRTSGRRQKTTTATDDLLHGAGAGAGASRLNSKTGSLLYIIVLTGHMHACVFACLLGTNYKITCAERDFEFELLLN